MSSLPSHGRVSCVRCFAQKQETEFDNTMIEASDGKWRISLNPLTWGSVEPEIVVLGFSKGPTQAGSLSKSPHDEIAYKGSRKNVGKILAHIDLLPQLTSGEYKTAVDGIISDETGRFHFGSLVRCTVERYDETAKDWKGSGGGMLDKFMKTPFGDEVATNCASQFLGALPEKTKLVVMFGLGTRLNYVKSARKLFEKALSGTWDTVNKVAYSNGKVIFVHVEHFAAQGRLIPNWLGENDDERADLGNLAKDAVRLALNK